MTDRPCVWEFPFSDAYVLARPEFPNLYILNPTATTAWRLLRSGKSLSDAAIKFARFYDISIDAATRDLECTWRNWQRTILTPFPSSAPKAPGVRTPPSNLPHCFSRDYRLHNRNIRVILSHPELVAEIAPRLEPLLTSPNSLPDATVQVTYSENAYQVFSGTTCIETEADPALARVIFLQELVRVAHASESWTAILHAAACGAGDKCVIFPAGSHSGKTTLAAALIHAGMTFYSDDSVALQGDSLKIPAMPFAMMIREGSWPTVSALFPQLQNTPIYERYGEKVRFLSPLNPASECAAALGLVFPQWVEKGSMRIERLDPFDTLARLQATGFWVAHDPTSIKLFLNWLLSLPSYQMTYSDLGEATAFVRQLLLAR